MRKFLLIGCLLAACFLYLGCSKKTDNCKSVSVESEEPAILGYAAANGITPVKHSSGLYYQVISQGSGSAPGMGSIVSVRYTGMFTNNDVFDQQQDASKTGWALNTLIRGWQIGIPLIQKGGKIKLLVPSSLAYGCSSVGSVPPNSILIFDIELVDVQ